MKFRTTQIMSLHRGIRIECVHHLIDVNLFNCVITIRNSLEVCLCLVWSLTSDGQRSISIPTVTRTTGRRFRGEEFVGIEITFDWLKRLKSLMKQNIQREFAVSCFLIELALNNHNNNNNNYIQWSATNNRDDRKIKEKKIFSSIENAERKKSF